MDRTSVEYLRRLSRLVLIEKKRREEVAIDELQYGIDKRLEDIKQCREFITRIDGVVAEKDKEASI